MLLFAYFPLKRSFLAKADGFARNGVGEFQFGGMQVKAVGLISIQWISQNRTVQSFGMGGMHA